MTEKTVHLSPRLHRLLKEAARNRKPPVTIAAMAAALLEIALKKGLPR